MIGFADQDVSIPARVRSLARNWLQRGQVDRDLDEEVHAYLDQLIDEKIDAGMSPPAARRAARIEMGGVAQVKAQVRASRTGAFLETVWQDIRYGARGLRRSPGFTAVVVVMLALGIGANSAIFGLLDALLLRPLPIKNPDELVALFTRGDGGSIDLGMAYPEYRELRDRSDRVIELTAHSPIPVSLGPERSNGRSAESDLVLGELASGNIFSVLGVEPSPGRGFLPEEDRTPGTDPVAVVSHRLWQRRFGGDPALVGRAIRINGHPFTVVGVAPEDFAGVIRGAMTDVWVPMIMQAQAAPSRSVFDPLEARRMLVLGRPRPGVAIEEAEDGVDRVARELRTQHPEYRSDAGGGARAMELLPERALGLSLFGRDPVLSVLTPLLVVVGLVLLLACANVSGLLLGRAFARRREFTVRLALGAGRLRLVRQLMTEGLLLSLLGGAAGLLVGRLGAQLLVGFAPPSTIPFELDLGLDGRVIGFTLGVALVASLLVGLMPALSGSRPDLLSALKDDSGTAGAWPRRGRARRAMMVAQIALSLVLLVGAGLFLRSLENARSTALGFDPDNLVAASVDLRLDAYDRAGTQVFARRWMERVRALPGVSGASLVVQLPLQGEGGRWDFTVEGSRAPESDGSSVRTTAVAPGFFDVMRMPLVRGRVIDERDLREAGEPLVVVVNQAFARRHWPGQDPIGKRLQIGVGPRLEPPHLTVVGLVADGKYDSFDEEPRPFVYVPLWQHFHWDFTLVARAAGDPSSWLEAIRREAHRLDENVSVFGERSLTDHLNFTLLPFRLLGSVLGALGLLALALAALGLYGLISYSVAQRTREIGIRRALGAQERDLLRLVVGHGMRLTALGLAIGLVAAAALARSLADVLYEVSPIDPLTFVAGPLLLAAVALLACYLPARRAVKLEPMTALRTE